MVLPRSLALVVVLTLGAWSGAAVASASATDWYAGPSGSGTACSQPAPCSLSTAVRNAAPGDTVWVTDGVYNMASTLIIAKAITLTGVSGGRPSLQNNSGDTVDASAGATVENLDLGNNTTSSNGADALDLNGAAGENLTVSVGSADRQGDGVSVEDTNASTPSTLKTALVTSAAPGGDAVSFKDSSTPGTASILNVTAVCTGSCGNAISGNMAGGSATVENSIAVGAPIATKPGTDPISISYSDFPSSPSTSVTSGAGNTSAAPSFVSSTDFHEAAGSPTVGAGTHDSTMTATDLDGNLWAATPDMGAYQSGTSASSTSGSTVPGRTPAVTGSTPAQAGITPSGHAVGDGKRLPPPSRPVAGVSFTVHPASGTVLVVLPRTTTPVPLPAGAELPVGTVIDTRQGAVVLTSAVSATGATKTGTFSGGRFVVSQARTSSPSTVLRLAGGAFAAACSAPSGIIHGPRWYATPYATRRPSHKVVRQLWGRDHGGRFVTVARGASAAVRGTVWLTQDRCDGTLVKVVKGEVLVHDNRRHRNVLVTAGHAYLARVA